MSVSAERLPASTEIASGGFGVIPGLVWAFRFHADGSAESDPSNHHREL